MTCAAVTARPALHEDSSDSVAARSRNALLPPILARPSAARRALKLRRDVLVEPLRSLGKMPSTTIGIDLKISRVRQRLMHGVPLLPRRRAVHG
jgi:hypothetical protein